MKTTILDIVLRVAVVVALALPFSQSQHLPSILMILSVVVVLVSKKQ
jgi:hypothetical protein